MTARRRIFMYEDEFGQKIGGTHSIPEDTKKHMINQECWCQAVRNKDTGVWHHYEARCVKRAKWTGWKING